MSEVNWSSLENHILLNPRFSKADTQRLMDCVAPWRGEFRSHVFILSSGTTAQSVSDLKWVALSKAALLASAAAVNQHLASRASDVWLHNLPDFHVGGIGIWARAHLSGARVITRPRWEAREFIHSIENDQVTLSSLVPAQVYDLVKAGLQCPKSMRAVLVGGGALSESLRQRAGQLGWPLLPTYGMTETSSQIATAALPSVKTADAAFLELEELQLLPHLQVREGNEGRLEISGESLFSAYIYWKDGKSVLEDPKNKGWFQTQDRGVLNGRVLKILGRLGDFVKIGGESVEVNRLRKILDEQVFLQRIQADVALIPVPDERLGHVIHLISESSLSTNDGEKLIEEFNSKVLGFERIRKWHCFEKLPRTELGKLIVADCLKKCLNKF